MSLFAGIFFQLGVLGGLGSHWSRLWSGQREEAGLIFLCGLSLVADVLVLRFHAAYPAHPKFRLLQVRARVLFLHVASGVCEIFCLVMAFFAPRQHLFIWARAGALAALLGHVPSSFFQTPGVFGIKVLMVPIYSFFIAVHAFCAIRLFLEPTSLDNLLQCFMILHTYAWVRVMYGIWRRLGILRDNEYTLAVVLAGSLTLPAVLGAMGNFVVLVVVLCFHYAVYPVLVRLGWPLWSSTSRELARTSVLGDDPAQKRRALAAIAAFGLTRDQHGLELLSDVEAAKKVFSVLDKDHDGFLSFAELINVANVLHISQIQLGEVFKMADADGNGGLDFGEFYRHLWTGPRRSWRKELSVIGSKNAAVLANLKSGKPRKVTEVSDFIFDMLDSDKSGVLELVEIQACLLAWGVDEAEVHSYMKSFDENRDGTIDRAEFFRHFEPLWSFAFQTLKSELEDSSFFMVS